MSATEVIELARRIGGAALAESLDVVLEAGGRRRASFAAQSGRVTINARDTISACVALHHYLRTACTVAVHWDTPLPLRLETLPDAPVTELTAKVEQHYFFNYVTFGYSMPYWTWEDWEREIDWLALHGVTMPLAITGFEAVLHDVFVSLGLPSKRALEYLGSPGYLPWTFMGGIESESPSMDDAWLRRQEALGQRIIERERALGMTPVLPVFTGQIPRELAPDGVAARPWHSYTTYLLDPEHPLFRELGTRIAAEQATRFGTDHLYASDPFIEMPPEGTRDDFPGLVARGIMDGLVAADAEARWVLQSWPFAGHYDYWTEVRVRQFLDGAGDRLVILDLWCEVAPVWKHLDSFGGIEWLWCIVESFGGNTDPRGDLGRAVRYFGEALAAVHPPSGIGCAMETTRNDHPYFELIADLAWIDVPDIADWITEFARQRGAEGEAVDAWRILAQSLYTGPPPPTEAWPFRGVVAARPDTVPTDPAELRRKARYLLWYRGSDLLEAWDLLTRALERDPALATGPLGLDLTQVAVAALCRVADELYARFLERRDRASADDLLAVFVELDGILACQPDHRLDEWVDRARDAGGDTAQAQQFAASSRKLVSTWTSEPGTLLDDYVGRIWHPMVSGYYRQRWSRWVEFGLAGFPAERAVDVSTELDKISRRFVDHGIPDEPCNPLELPTRSRAAVRRYGRVLADLDVHRLDPASTEGLPSAGRASGPVAEPRA